MSTSIRFPGRNTIALCPMAIMQIVEQALNERAYDTKENPVRVTGIEAIAEGGTTAFHVTVTTDKAEAA